MAFNQAVIYGEIKSVRNLDPKPYIQTEGVFTKSLPEPYRKPPKNSYWFEVLQPYERLHLHQTLNSSRRFAGFRPLHKIPIDSLDFVLAAQYHHGIELFADKVDVVLQFETIGRRTFRRLKNTRDLDPERNIAIGHPLTIGGIKERISPHSVKLINSGPHTSTTNPGYSRQTGDGNFFNY